MENEKVSDYMYCQIPSDSPSLFVPEHVTHQLIPRHTRTSKIITLWPALVAVSVKNILSVNEKKCLQIGVKKKMKLKLQRQE